ncbi:MAG TPA: hypothetical protein VH300_00255 [Thermoleophilaceae bacterium]|jgi:uncharacterized membrane protein|nr:hypothetical protein [Thermoleophilaceae bacterium]
MGTLDPGIKQHMQRYIQSLGLSARWWWGAVGGCVLIALIFLAAGSTAAALVCIVCAIGIAALALYAGSSRSTEQP